MKLPSRLFALLLVLPFLLQAQTADQTFLIDFGPDDGNNGNATASPDANGNHWNNATNSAVSAPAVNLVNDAGDASELTLSVAAVLSTNGINHGGLLMPEAALLNEFAINTATQDYFFTNNTGAVIFGGLDPAKGYRFSFFASRNTTQTRISQYDLSGATTVTGTLQSSGTDLGGNGYNGNNSTLYTSDLLFADASGEVRIDLSRAAGDFAYINLMQVQEFSDFGTVAVEAIAVNGADITEPGQARQMEAVISPADATFQGVSWSVDDPTTALVTGSGLLIPFRDGNVVVTATTLEEGSTVSGSKTVTISGQAAQDFFVDFGPVDGVSGNPTDGPDPNGHYWNNVADPDTSAAPVVLVNAENTATAYTVKIAKSLAATGLPDGGLNEPDPDLLNSLGVATATQDHFRTSNFGLIEFTGLDAESGYRFQLLASANHDGPRTTAYQLSGFNGFTADVQASGPDLGGDGIDNNVREVITTDVIFPDENGRIRLRVGVALGLYGYVNALRMTEYGGLELCPEVDNRLIAVMGSSVARGQGAPNDMGYAFQYGELLEDRFADGEGADWALTNISIGGNTTQAVLDRWSTDLAPLCGRYVVYGLSLANEGVISQGQVAFDRFRDNLEILIQRAQSRDIIPLVVGNYSRGGYTDTEYAFIKDINLLIHQWDVASINVLGTNDDGGGNWVAGYQDDPGHPNLAGHTEFFHAFVPSLFDALDDGKPQPERVENTFLAYGSDFSDEPIVFEPEETVHSFTYSIDVRTGDSGRIVSFQTPDGNGSIEISPGGQAVYTAPDGSTLTGELPVNDGEWHRLTLTHYFARQRSFLYLDGERADGSVNEQIVLETSEVAGLAGPETADYRDWFFYRSAMTPEEISALHAGAMLKSSLELYAPLDGQGVIGDDIIVNLAQSLNKPQNDLLNGTTELSSVPLRVFPNPVTDQLTVTGIDVSAISRLELYDAAGRLVTERKKSNELSTAKLKAGVYWLRVYGRNGIIGAQKVVKR